MFKNLQLGAKIAWGFGTILLIAVMLGTLAVWNMNGVRGGSDMLAKEYVPEVDMAVSLRANVSDVMYEMRGYGFTEDESFLKAAHEHLKNVEDDFEKGYELEKKAKHLKKLKAQLEVATEAKENYEGLMKKTEELVATINGERQRLDASAGQFMGNCEKFLRSQNDKMVEEIGKGVPSAALKERLAKVVYVNNVIDMGNAMRIATWRSQAQREPALIENALPKFAEINDNLRKTRELVHQQVNLDQLDEIEKSGNNYKDAMQNLLAAWKTLQTVGSERTAAGNKLTEACDETMRAGMEHTQEIATNAANSLSISSTIMFIGLVIAIAIGILLAIFITAGITKPINVIINTLSSGANQVSSASEQLSGASQQLSEGASEQASSLEEISSSLEEMSSMTKQNADNANQADVLMGDTKSLVAQGKDAMSRLTSAIAEIKNSSDQTAKIIKNIDEIAFQTNLLALNAAVEAARAGEAGKGFAVVAEEVRSLAQRAAEAAKDTAALIEQAQKNSENGVNLAEENSKSMDTINEGAEKVAGLIAEIAAASKEQSQGIEQVNTAVAQLDQVTQSNAANAEESASAAEELSAQAVSMTDAVGSLVTIVRGANAHNDMSMMSAAARPALMHRPAQIGNYQKAAMPQKRPQQMAHSHTEGMRKSRDTGHKHITPQDILPLDDDDLKDF
jgi:methyl-accepting chemotaxis protein